MIFIESSRFTELVSDYLSDDEYAAFQWYLMIRPDAGDVVAGSGGVRKIRWQRQGRGKRGGVRVIYLWKQSDSEVWLLTMYAKNEKETIPAHILKQIAREINDN